MFLALDMALELAKELLNVGHCRLVRKVMMMMGNQNSHSAHVDGQTANRVA